MKIFSYGSNLNPAQWSRRCPSAALLGVGELRGHRLTFTGASGGWGGAVATVKPAKGESVPGAVYELRDPDDVRRLDAAEGFPYCYGCKKATVHLRTGGRPKAVEVWVYVKVDRAEGWPSNSYAQTIADGLRAHGLKIGHLAAALAALPASAPLPFEPVKRKPVKRKKRKRNRKRQRRWMSCSKGHEFIHAGLWKRSDRCPECGPEGHTVTIGVEVKGKRRGKGKRRKAKAHVVWTHPCAAPNDPRGCGEELTNPCPYCAALDHCAHHCPEVAPCRVGAA